MVEEAFGKLHRRIGHRFCRSEARERTKRYLLGLLGSVERKNGWQMAEAFGEHHPQGVQRLLNSAKWDADAVRDDLREYIVEHLGDEESGVLIVDETGFLKKGEKSVGVARQYTGTAGDTVNCQVGVFLAYASEKRAAFLDRALYLPRAWTGDHVRRAEAAIPEEPVFRNKIELAEEMLERVFEADVPARWVVADSFYGRSHAFRVWLEERGRPYAVMVPKTNAIPLGGRKKKIRALRRAFGRGRVLRGAPGQGYRRRAPVGVGLHGAGPGAQEGHEALAIGTQEHRRPRSSGLLPSLRTGGDDRGGTRPGVPGALGRGGVLRRGQGRGGPGPLRGEEVGCLASPRNPLPARPRLPGRHPPGGHRRGRKP
jgi:hypothetical protein